MPARELHLLILGGTAEARLLAEAALARFAQKLRITTSLAGRTRNNATLPGTVRRGGFGGTRGLAAFLREARVDLMIDATHPFARRISAMALEASGALDLPFLALERPSWTAQEGDRWIEVANASEAAERLPSLGQRVFLTIGHRDIAAFSALPNIHFIVRLIEAPDVPLPLSSYELLLARGPFAVEAEMLMMKHHAIDVLVTKASGGEAMAGKLAAARALGLPVVMLRRPTAISSERVARVEDALDWIACRLRDLAEAPS